MRAERVSRACARVRVYRTRTHVRMRASIDRVRMCACNRTCAYTRMRVRMRVHGTARDRRVCLNKHRLYRLFLSLNVLSDMKLHQPTLKRLKLTFPAVLNPDLYPLRGTSCHPLHSSLFIPALSVSGLALRGPGTWFRTRTIK